MNPSRNNWGGPRPGAGRPRKLEQSLLQPRRPRSVSVDELEMLARLGAKQSEIAAYFGISVRSLQLLARQYPEVREARQRGRSLGELDLLFALWQRMPTSDRILRFLSKMYLGWTTT
jgi:hypothetical protein